jgi:magnesium transporter
MAVVAAYLYRDGARVRSVSIEDKADCAKDKSEFVWIGIADPTTEEMRALQECYDLHPLAVEDAIVADQLPKVDVYDDQLFVVARTARLIGETIEYGETAIFVGHSHLITVRHGSERAHTALREQLEKAPKLLMHGTDYVLHAVLDYIVDGYAPLVDDIEEEVLDMEIQAADSFLNREQVNHIFALRRELGRMQRILGPMYEVALKLARQELPCIEPEARAYFRDVQDHVRRVQSRVEALRDALNAVFQLSQLIEQQRVGTITRQLAAWAAILAVPTAIAGIYGMNFQDMPELHERYGYPIVLVVMIAICLWLYNQFKRTGWL